MVPTITRRELLQWLGGVTAGAVLSPAPFALIDDLTIATQTRARPRCLPAGDLSRFRTRCPGCSAGCAIDVLTVGGQPYLCVPAGERTRGSGCALLPVLHQLSLHRRLAGPIQSGKDRLSLAQARDLAMRWLDNGSGPERIGFADFGPPSRGVTGLSSLATAVGSVTWIQGPAPRAPFTSLAARLEVGPDLELALDPSRIDRIVTVDAGTSMEGPVALELARIIEQAVAAPDSMAGTAVLTAIDGSGTRLDPGIEALATEANLATGAVGRGGAIVARRRHAPWPAGERSLEEIPDGSLKILVVDASRAGQALPWRRLRRKISPTHGHLVAITPWTDAALAHADLVLPAAAPLEIEEFVGGDDRRPECRLALVRPLHDPPHPVADALWLAREVDANAPDPLEQTAASLLSEPGARVTALDGSSRAITAASPDALLAELRKGGQWRGAVLDPPKLPASAAPRLELLSARSERPDHRVRIRIASPTVLGAGIPLPPVLAKLSRETRLLAGADTARVHPDTFRRLGLDEGTPRILRTNRGEFRSRFTADRSVEPDALVLSTACDPAGFDTDPSPGQDLLGRVDVDPRNDRPRDWILEEVV